MIINPDQPGGHNLTDDGLLRFWLFCCAVAGKSADTQAKAVLRFEQWLRYLDRQRYDIPADASLAAVIRRATTSDLLKALIKGRVGQYKRLLDILTWTREKLFSVAWLRYPTPMLLEECPGVGRKTSRYFTLYVRPRYPCAVLDRHILRWLKARGVPNVPDNTPASAAAYDRLEREFLAAAREIGSTPAELDLDIWVKSRSRVYQQREVTPTTKAA